MSFFIFFYTKLIICVCLVWFTTWNSPGSHCSKWHCKHAHRFRVTEYNCLKEKSSNTPSPKQPLKVVCMWTAYAVSPWSLGSLLVPKTPSFISWEGLADCFKHKDSPSTLQRRTVFRGMHWLEALASTETVSFFLPDSRQLGIILGNITSLGWVGIDIMSTWLGKKCLGLGGNCL